MEKEREAGPYQLTDDEKACIKTIRERIPDIPSDLNTDLNLRRWHKGWKGQVEQIIPRFEAYIRNRKAAGFDVPDFVERMPNLPIVQRFLKYYSISRFLVPIVDKRSNSVLFIQRVGGVYHDALIKVIPTHDILLLYFAFCELSLRHILATEAATGWPSAMTVILDLKNVPLNEYINPTSPANVLMRLCMNIFQDWYCEFLHKSLVVHPPAVVNVLWQVGKACLNENTLSKILVTNKIEEIKDHMDPSAIPVGYGGTFRDETGFGVPEFGTPDPKPITEEDYFPVGKMWTDLGIEEPEKTKEYVKPGKTLRLERWVDAGQRLAWNFFINGEMSFRVVRIQGDVETTVIPEFTLVTLAIPEESSLVAAESALHALEFRNTSSYLFAIKVDIGIAVK